MGIPSAHARLLMRVSKQRLFNGSVLQLGRQDIALDDKTLQSIADEESFSIASVKGGASYRKSRFNEFTVMDDVYFFKALGFSSVLSLDVSDYECADILHDLNVPISSVSTNNSKFDLIYDGGTLEHIFHVPNVLRNIFNLLSVNGRVIHAVPVDIFNHGFYNFSSCLFEDFYGVNSFQINACWMVRMRHNSGEHFFTPADRDSQFIRSLCNTSFKNANHNLFFVATKLPASTGDKIPTQGYYEKVFLRKGNVDNSGLVSGNSRLKSAYVRLRSIPGVRYVAKTMRDIYAQSLVKWERI